jgi:hypothetical protein
MHKKDKLPTGRKYLEITYPMMGMYPKHVNKSENSSERKQLDFEMNKRLKEILHK